VAHYPYPLAFPGAIRASQVPSVSLHTCRALRRPRQTLGELTKNALSVLASGAVTPSPSASSSLSGLYQDFRECGLPCGLRSSLCTLHLLRSANHPPSSSASSADATLGTGGWLGLARQGLPPCKKTPSFLGAQRPRAKLPGGSRQLLPTLRLVGRQDKKRVSPSPPGQSKILVISQGFSELLGCSHSAPLTICPF
jgi:hypothetical protein